MDQNLVRWARAVKSRARHSSRSYPVLWLFTDATRVPDPLAAVRALARLRLRGLAGVVFRPEGYTEPQALVRELVRQCRAGGLKLTVAGNIHAPGAGRHLRGGRGARTAKRGVMTSSAHDRAELLRAARAGARIIFLSPVFVTRSHPGAQGLGVLHWAALRNTVAGCAEIFALGGIDGRNVHRLPRVQGVGAITVLV